MDEELAYLVTRYELETAAADHSNSKEAQVRHLELALRYALAAAQRRSGRRTAQSVVWMNCRDPISRGEPFRLGAPAPERLR